MSFDAWVVGFGLSRVLIDLSLVGSPWAYGVLAATILIDVYLLYLFFKARAPQARSVEQQAASAGGVPPNLNYSPVSEKANVQHDPFGRLLAWAIGGAGISMLAHAFY